MSRERHVPLTSGQRMALDCAVVFVKVCAVVALIAAMAWLAVNLAGCAKPGEATQAHQSAARPPFRSMAHVTGTSMLPAYGTDEWVNLDHVPFNELKTGDTVIYWNEQAGDYRHHRIDSWDRTTGRWIIKGDNNPNVDRGIMSPDQFEGRTSKLFSP